MSRTLTLNQAGWSAVQSLRQCGRRREALMQAERLLDRDDLSREMRAEALRAAAELALETERFARAKYYVRELLKLEPEAARNHDLAGQVIERDPDGEDRKAAACYRRACRRDPKNMPLRARFGRAAVRCGRRKLGVRVLKAVAKTAPGHAAAVRVAVEGLLEAGCVNAARRALTVSRFRCPNDRALAALWERMRFEAARLIQNTSKTQEARFATEGDIALLPFVRIVRSGRGPTPQRSTVRRDVLSLSHPHFPRLRTLNADR